MLGIPFTLAINEGVEKGMLMTASEASASEVAAMFGSTIITCSSTRFKRLRMNAFEIKNELRNKQLT